MTSTPTILNEAEALVHSQAVALTQPHADECLCCYVARLLDEFPCDCTLRHAIHYRDIAAPRASALVDRLESMGGFCDCEIFLNGYQLSGADPEVGLDDLPPCTGVRRGSVQPCGNWVRIRRW